MAFHSIPVVPRPPEDRPSAWGGERWLAVPVPDDPPPAPQPAVNAEGEYDVSFVDDWPEGTE